MKNTTPPVHNDLAIILGPFLCLPPADCGAVERRWLEIAEALANGGRRIQFVSKQSVSDVEDHSSRMVDGRISHRYVRGYSRSGKIYLDILKDFFYTVRALRNVDRRANFIFVNTFWAPILIQIFRLFFTANIVVHVARLPRIHHLLYRFVDRFDAVSGVVKSRLGMILGRNILRKTVVIPNPIDLSIFFPLSSKVQPSHEFKILYVGRLHPEKGLHYLISAINRLSARGFPVRLTVVGPWEKKEGGGGTCYLASLKRQSILGTICFFGPVYDKSALANIYRDHDIFCYPSVAENGESFGLAPLEAMACGLPVIVSDLPCFSDYLEDRVNGMKVSHRSIDFPGELETAIMELIENPYLLQCFTVAGPMTAKKFGVNEIAERYETEYLR